MAECAMSNTGGCCFFGEATAVLDTERWPEGTPVSKLVVKCPAQAKVVMVVLESSAFQYLIVARGQTEQGFGINSASRVGLDWKSDGSVEIFRPDGSADRLFEDGKTYKYVYFI